MVFKFKYADDYDYSVELGHWSCIHNDTLNTWVTDTDLIFKLRTSIEKHFREYLHMQSGFTVNK